MIDDRQFIIRRQPLVREGWKSISLQCGLVLSYHQQLRVCHNEECSVLLLGHAWQVLPDALSPSELVKSDGGDKSLEQIYDMEQSWCGRYILICNDLLLLDNCGMMGVFYSSTSISSSIRVLCHAEGRDVVNPDIKYGVSPNFMPGPLTGYDGIFRLLPSQVLKLAISDTQSLKFTPLPRPLLPFGVRQFSSEKAQLDFFINIFTTSLRNMRSHFPDHVLCLALTGGVDSRVAMSLLEASGLDYITFTAWHPRITTGDCDIPPYLARLFGRSHKLVMRSELSQNLYDDYTTHSGGYAVDQDRNFWAYGQYGQLSEQVEGKPVLLLRNSIWECTDDHYRHHTDPLDIYRLYPYALQCEPIHQSIEYWRQLVADDPYNQDINSWTRLFWDQREGCWLSSLEQAYDMMDGITSVQMCNCRLFMSTLMSFDEKERFHKIHEKKIMRQALTDNAQSQSFLRVPYDSRYNGYSLRQPPLPFMQRLPMAVRYYRHNAVRSLKTVAKRVLRRK